MPKPAVHLALLAACCYSWALVAAANNAGPPEPLSTLPEHISFVCAPDQLGFFADVELSCQIFHVCQGDGRVDSYFCPNQTLFNQKYLVCDWWYNVNCQDSPQYYGVNDELLTFRGTKNPYGSSLPNIIAPSASAAVPLRVAAEPISHLPSPAAVAPAPALLSKPKPAALVPIPIAKLAQNAYPGNNHFASGSRGIVDSAPAPPHLPQQHQDVASAPLTSSAIEKPDYAAVPSRNANYEPAQESVKYNTLYNGVEAPAPAYPASPYAVGKDGSSSNIGNSISPGGQYQGGYADPYDSSDPEPEYDDSADPEFYDDAADPEYQAAK